MAQMNTDAAVLAKEAANFERISGELKGVISHAAADPPAVRDDDQAAALANTMGI
jgi:hypothetical protein